MSRAEEIMATIKSLNVPTSLMGVPDICSIADKSIRDKIFAFIKDVNANGGYLPTPNCNA